LSPLTSATFIESGIDISPVELKIV